MQRGEAQPQLRLQPGNSGRPHAVGGLRRVLQQAGLADARLTEDERADAGAVGENGVGQIKQDVAVLDGAQPFGLRRLRLRRAEPRRRAEDEIAERVGDDLRPGRRRPVFFSRAAATIATGRRG